MTSERGGDKDSKVKHLPIILLDQLRGVAGYEEKAFIDAHQRAAPTSVRLHPKKQWSGLETVSAVPWCLQGRYLSERPIFTLDPAFHAGAYYVQEASSMFLDYIVKAVLPVRSNLRVLDLCGAPGGKSTLLASLLGDNSLLISNEVIRTRATILEENAVRWGYTNNWVTSNDPKELGRIEGYFDLMVIDAPCSGSGLFRKDPAALKEWSGANVQLCCQRQKRIIADVWSSLKEDGVLIYATCSYSPEEDEEILDWVAEEYYVESLNVELPAEWGIAETESAKGLTGYRFFPNRVQGEGFFIAAIRKKESAETVRHLKYKSQADEKAKQRSSFLLDREDLMVIPASKEAFHAISPDHEADWQLLQKHLYFRKVGATLGMASARDWIPAHDVALSVDRSKVLPAVDLSREQALKFLKREDVSLPSTEKGWLLVTYEGLGLGWIKSLGNRFNNYLPKHWRIRMDLG